MSDVRAVQIKIEELQDGLAGRKRRRRRRRGQVQEASAAPEDMGHSPYVTMNDLTVMDDASMAGPSVVADVRQSAMAPVWGVLGVVSSGLSAYHGYRRNQSIPWALVWAVMGGALPVVTPAIAFAQGFGQRAR